LAIRDYGVVAYLGVPLTTDDGHTLGSLCAVDSQPREWQAAAVEILQELAAAAMTEIRLRMLARACHAQYVAGRTLELQRDELVHMLVHDMRNPLQSLLSGLDLLGTSELTDEAAEDLAMARGGADRVLQMVSDILDVSKASAGRLTLVRTWVSPVDLLGHSRVQLSPLAITKGVDLRVEVIPDVPLVSLDEEHCRRVLVNLVANAIQHTPKGGRVTLSASTEDGTGATLFSVRDTGRGIPAHAYDTIFDKFGQVGVRRAGVTSTGLGLPFSKMVVEAHGGRIWVESEVGVGTAFRFVIPQNPDDGIA
jgi:signal transduction histidine kinase